MRNKGVLLADFKRKDGVPRWIQKQENHAFTPN